MLGALSALGLGFLINALILIPLLGLFLGATIWALHQDRRRHDRGGPERLAWAAALATVGGLWLSVVDPVSRTGERFGMVLEGTLVPATSGSTYIDASGSFGRRTTTTETSGRKT